MESFFLVFIAEEGGRERWASFGERKVKMCQDHHAFLHTRGRIHTHAFFGGAMQFSGLL